MSVELVALAILLVILLAAHRQAVARFSTVNGQASEEGPLDEAEAARSGVIVTEIFVAGCIVFAVARFDGTPFLVRFAIAAVVMVVGFLLVIPGSSGDSAPRWLPWAGSLLGRRRRPPSNDAPPPPAADPFDERVLLDRMLRFRETEIEEVMVPRIDMVAVEKQADVRALLDLVEEHRHSRYPVYEEDIDRVVEYVNVFDLFKLPPGTQSFREVVRDALVVPETKHCADLLEEMAAADREFALAVDEYGGTAGLVTREDLIEELVGEIWDEHEKESVMVRRVGKDVYVATAAVTLDEVRSVTGVELPDGDYETLAGFLLEQFGRIPVRGDTVRYESAAFEVLVANRRRIDSVQINLDRPGGRS